MCRNNASERRAKKKREGFSGISASSVKNSSREVCLSLCSFTLLLLPPAAHVVYFKLSINKIYPPPWPSFSPPPPAPPPPLRLLSLSLPALSSDVSLQQRSFPSPVSNKTGDWCQSSFTFSPSFRLLLVLSTLYSFIYVLMYSWAVLRRRYPARTTPGGVGLGVVSTSCLPK